MISEEKYIELIENVLGITLEDNLDQKNLFYPPLMKINILLQVRVVEKLLFLF